MDDEPFFSEEVCNQLQSQADAVRVATMDRAKEKNESIETKKSNKPKELIESSELNEPNEEPQPEHIHLLRTKFKHNEFRTKQWDIIRTLIIEKRDVVGVMATGYGKSLCYQYPAVLDGLTLVVSPLIALMQDQVIGLEKNGIRACFLGSAQSDKTMPDRVANNEFLIVYASPEYLLGYSGQALLRKIRNKIKLIAIDEAHCVVQWGFDFRPEFRRLGEIRYMVPKVPIVALTATATESARHDIATVLNLRRPKFVVSNFDRSNLEFIIQPKTDTLECGDYEYWKDLQPLIEDGEGSKIVYVLKRFEAKELSELINQKNIKCAFYHSDMETREKEEVLRKFKNDEIKVVVATIAFGMGVDKRDVRYVIHYGAPATLEKYYQEVGRAGRDGQPSKVITFFSREDFGIHDYWLQDKALTSDVKKLSIDLHSKMRAFLYSTQCRRRQILEYFGEDPRSIAPRPKCCDNCSLGLSAWRLSDIYEGVSDDGVYDFGCWARVLMSAVPKAPRKEKFAIVRYLKQSFEQNPFGNEADESAKPYFWEAVIWQLCISGLLKIEYVPIPNETRYETMLEYTELGKNWLQSCKSHRKLELKACGLMYAFFTKKGNTPSINQAVARSFRFVCDDEKMKRFLYEVRNVLAAANNVMPFLVMNDAVIEQLVKHKPNNMNEFKMYPYEGFNTDRLQKFAPTIVNAICKYKAGELDMGFRLVVDSMPHVRQLAPPHLLVRIQSGENVFEIADEFQITIEQTTKHAVELIKRGKLITLAHLKTFCGDADACDPVDIHEQLTDEDLCATTPPDVCDSIVERIHKECPNASKIFIEVVLAYYQVRKHLKSKRHPYVDVVDDTLVKGKLLIPPKPSTPPEPEHDAKPWRFNPLAGLIDIDEYFRNRVDDYDPEGSICSEDSDTYNGDSGQEESDEENNESSQTRLSQDESSQAESNQVDLIEHDGDDDRQIQSDYSDTQVESDDSEVDNDDDEYDLPVEHDSDEDNDQQFFTIDEEEDSLWGTDGFDPTFNCRESIEFNDDSDSGDSQRSGSTIQMSIDSAHDTNVEDVENGFEVNGIIDERDLETQKSENIVATLTSSSMRRTSSFQLSMSSESCEDADDLCSAVLDAFETLFEPPIKKAKIFIPPSDV